MKKISVKQVRSAAGRDKKVKAALAAMGLGRIGKAKELPDNAAVRGMIAHMAHLLVVTEK